MNYLLSPEQECPMSAVTHPGMASSWSLLGSNPTAQLGFGSSMDVAKLEQARMLLSGMDDGRATGQDEDGDT